MRWTRGPLITHQRTWSITHLSELIVTVDRASYNGPHSIIQRISDLITIARSDGRSNEASSQTRDEIKSRPFTSDQTVIKRRHRFTNGCVIATVNRDHPLHPKAAPKSASLKTVLRDGRTCAWIFVKFDLFRPQFHVWFVSLYS